MSDPGNPALIQTAAYKRRVDVADVDRDIVVFRASRPSGRWSEPVVEWLRVTEVAVYGDGVAYDVEVWRSAGWRRVLDDALIEYPVSPRKAARLAWDALQLGG